MRCDYCLEQGYKSLIAMWRGAFEKKMCPDCFTDYCKHETRRLAA